jgi:predicted RNA-binding protein YlxR (DUF448 family)
MLATLDHIEEHDAGPKAPGSERFCVVERAVKPVADLVRFVAGPDGGVLPDIKRKLPGRGVWVTATRAAVAEAVKRGALKRGLKANINVPADLADVVDRLLVRSALDALAIANKAGDVVTGFERVERALAMHQVAAQIHAADAAPDGVRKLTAARARQNEGNQAPAIAAIRAFTASQLDLALGRPNVVHAALLGGREGVSFLARWQTLERYRLNAGREAPKRAGNETAQPDAAPELGTE